MRQEQTINTVNIRMVQHYLYCPHRWGLLEIDRAWAENYFIVRAELLHQRVHDTQRPYTARNRKVFTAVPVWNDLPQYDLYGVADCLEQSAATGAEPGLTIVEYKPTSPKGSDYHEADALQVFAQKLCVDYVFGGSCRAELYYADRRRRVVLPFDLEYAYYDHLLQQVLEEIRGHLSKGTIPPKSKGQKCGGCSMRDLCMPQLKQSGKLRQQIAALTTAGQDTVKIKRGGDW